MDITIVYLSVSPYSRPPLLSTYYIYYIHQKKFLLSFFSSPFFLFFCLFRNGPPGPDDTARPWKRRQVAAVRNSFSAIQNMYVCIRSTYEPFRSHTRHEYIGSGGAWRRALLIEWTSRVSLTEEGMYVWGFMDIYVFIRYVFKAGSVRVRVWYGIS